MKRLITLETALTASSNKDELQDMINRGVGVVPAPAWRAGRAARPTGGERELELRTRERDRTRNSERGPGLCRRLHYAGRTRAGQTVSGERAADTMDAAVAALRREQIIVTRITPAKAAKARQPTQGQGRARSARRSSAKNLAVFTRQFSVMIDAGLPLVQCLDILGSAGRGQELRRRHPLRRAPTSSRARRWPTRCASIPKTFDPLFTNMIAAGEAGGILDTILKRLATYIEKAVKLAGQVKSAMIYPVAVIVIAGAVVGVILWKVIPTFAALFSGLGADLPLPTRGRHRAQRQPGPATFPFLFVGGGARRLRLHARTTPPTSGRRVVDGDC